MLEALGDGVVKTTHEVAGMLADKFQLSPEDRSERLPSGGQTYLLNRTGWAGFHLQRAGLVTRPRRATWQITPEGQTVLKGPSFKLDRNGLLKFPAFRDFIENDCKRKGGPEALAMLPVESTEAQPPNERIEEAFSQLNDSLASDLRDQMAKMDPYRFEQLVLDLLRAMGYGGPREESGWVTKKSGDGGIDGIINEDRLGLDVIYVQAKRWQNNVGTNEIRNFIGALSENHANKGVFITTSDFVPAARESARKVSQKVILIDGQRLAELMIEHNIGVTTTRTIALKRIDSDYFEEG